MKFNPKKHRQDRRKNRPYHTAVLNQHSPRQRYFKDRVDNTIQKIKDEEAEREIKEGLRSGRAIDESTNTQA